MEQGISVVIPVYNGARSLTELVGRLNPVLASLASRFEIILVNDGSTDESWDTIKELADKWTWVKGIDLMRNYGQHNSLLVGIRAAAYDVVVTMDDDLQHPPEEIPRLISMLEEGFDVVYGDPLKGGSGLWRALASRLTRYVLQKAMGAETARKASAYRAFRTCIRKAFADYGSPFVSIDVLLSWGTARFGAVSVRHDPRKEGKSSYTLRKLVSHAINMMTGFSIWPLRFASLVGFAFTIFGLGVLGYVLIRYIASGGSVPGFPFLASIIAIFSGAQLFALGIIGEYLARLHFRSMGRPYVSIRRIVGAQSGGWEQGR
ncbi:MAG: glycosyltransferase [Desulfobacteraceae bacterium]|nr:MAG: glycosyltransferase [Desulfobacteraceae bacterium]